MNFRRLEVVVDATDLVVSVDEFKMGARVTSGSVEDAFIGGLLRSAQVMVENHVGMSLAPRTLRMRASHWPGCQGLVMMYPPVVAVASVKYLDDAGVLQTLPTSNYDVDIDGNLRPTISLAWSQTWPILRRHPAPVQVEYTSGKAAANCPAPLKEAIRMIAQDLYENRESQITSQYFGERSVIENPSMRRMLMPYTLWEM